MKLVSFLPRDRFQPGVFFALEGSIVYGPVWCRGEADNAGAARAGNPEEDPTQPYGDHPAGISVVDDIVDIPEGPDRKKYGPHFIRLEPLEGEALAAKDAGRTGIGLHGGAPGQTGTPNVIRATYGCLRMADRHLVEVVALIRERLVGRGVVLYECHLIAEDGVA